MIDPININMKYRSQEAIKRWLDLYDTILTDCDGVLWHDDMVIPHVPETINLLKSLGKNIYFVTNNSTKTRHDLWLKANTMLFRIDESHIISPTFSIAKYLKRHLNKDEKVYVIGGAAITQELNNFDIVNFGIDEDIMPGNWNDKVESIKSIADVEKVSAVVVGFDEHYNSIKMLKAFSFLGKNTNCKFMATNTDAVHRYPNFCIPGTGAILQSLETCVGRKAQLMGKPNPIICEHLTRAGIIEPKRTLMIGDCAQVDVVFGKNCRFQTLLVGTGNFKWSNVQSWVENNETDFIPHYYSESLGDLLAFLN